MHYLSFGEVIVKNIFELQGEFPEPDPSLWTNEELGIPPDDYEE